MQFSRDDDIDSAKLGELIKVTNASPAPTYSGGETAQCVRINELFDAFTHSQTAAWKALESTDAFVKTEVLVDNRSATQNSASNSSSS